MLLVLWLELRKLAAQRGVYAGFAVLAVMVALFAWGMKLHPPSPRGLGGEFVVGGSLVSGEMLAYMMLAARVAPTVLMPLLIAVVAGGLVASEARAGTLRYILCRPVSRGGLLAGKLMASWSHAAGLSLFMGAFALIVGWLLFGSGDLMTVEGGLSIFAGATALKRLALAYLLTAAGMCAVASVAVLLSVICDNPLTAAGITVAFLLVSAALQVIPYFERLEPHMLTAHLDVCQKAFAADLPVDEIRRSTLYIIGYVVAASSAGLAIFSRRDVVS